MKIRNFSTKLEWMWCRNDLQEILRRNLESRKYFGERVGEKEGKSAARERMREEGRF